MRAGRFLRWVYGEGSEPDRRCSAARARAGVPVVAWAGWGATERTLRRSEPLPSSRVAPVLAVGTSAVGVLVVLGLVLP